ncbi:MAG: hypothetical protein HYY40_08960 [Bacteroidetes bacterium]|nr:hypothetical protein [Bacteroidota bacterium]
MKNYFYLIFNIALVFVSGRVYCQNNDSAWNSEIQFHLNWIGDHYSKYFFDFFIDDRMTNKYYLIYNKKKEYPNEYYDDETISIYRFYYAGLAFSKNLNKNILGNQLMVRCRFDVFNYYDWYSHTHTSYVIDSTSRAYWEKSSYSIKSWQLTPGIGLLHSWKFFDFKAGAEIPLYLRGTGEWVNDKKESYYPFQTSQNISERQGITPGGYFIGFSLFGNINIVILQRITFGIEGSGGIIYVHPFYANIYEGWVYPKITTLFHYPSLTFSYKF